MKELLTRLLLTQDDNARQEIATQIAALDEEGVDLIVNEINKGHNLRVYLLTLSRIISNNRCKNALDDKWSRLNYKPLINSARSDDPKVRKNAYIIMGELSGDILKKELIKALEREDTLMIIPSLILAIGNSLAYEALGLVKSKVEHYKQSLTDKEHSKALKEIIRAGDKTIDKLYTNNSRHIFKGFDRDVQIALSTMDINPDVTLYDAKRYYNAYLKDNYVIITTKDYNKVFNLRTFYESFIVFPDWWGVDYSASNIAKLLAKKLKVELLDKWHQSNAPYRYRIELKGNMINRSSDIDNLVAEIGKAYGSDMINSPSNYEMELRITVEDDKCNLLVKLYTLEDNRFSYRKRSLPASIKGETAAICMSLVRKYLKDSSRVLDPFAGTGTMLIERAKLNKDLSLTGVDISREAIDYLKENTQAAGVAVKAISNDIVNYNSSEQYDEIISNMPYGLRVGTHKNNEILYLEFLRKAKTLISNNGLLILLTADYKLLKSIAWDEGFRMIDEFIINSGGLMPHLIVFKKKSKP